MALSTKDFIFNNNKKMHYLNKITKENNDEVSLVLNWQQHVELLKFLTMV